MTLNGVTDQISALSKSCYITHRNFAASDHISITKLPVYIIATSIVHSKFDYCNSLYYNLPNTQLNRLQHIQNSLARAVVTRQGTKIFPYHPCSQIFTLA